MDKLENALYTIVRDKIKEENYKDFNDLLQAYKAVYNMSDNEIYKDPADIKNSDLTDNVKKQINKIKDIYKNFGITTFSDNSKIILTYNDVIDNILTNGYYKNKTFNSKNHLEFDTYNTPVKKYKFGYLISKKENLTNANIKIEPKDTDEFDNVKSDIIDTFIKNINKIIDEISEDKLSIISIIKTIFDLKLEFSITENFNELLIPLNLITVLNDTTNEDALIVDNYKKVYNELIYYLDYDDKKKINDMDFIKFISENIINIDLSDIQSIISNIDVQGEFKEKEIEDGKTIIELNINKADEQKFKNWNNKISEILTKILNIDNNLNLSELLNKEVQINISFNGNNSTSLSITKPLKDIFIRLCATLGQDILNFKAENLNNIFKSQKIPFTNIIFSNADNINTLKDGLYSELKQKFKDELKNDSDDMKNIFNKESLELLINPDNPNNITKFVKLYFKNNVEKKDCIEKFFNFWITGINDNKYIRFLYSLLYIKEFSKNNK